MQSYLIASLTLLLLAFVQNVAFSITSRSRNRNNFKYHLIAAFFSNALWFLTFRALVTRDMSLQLFPWYCAGTMVGSVVGVRISMWVERLVGAESDSHIKKKETVVNVVNTPDDPKQLEEFSKRLRALEQRFPDRIFDPEALLGGPSDR